MNRKTVLGLLGVCVLAIAWYVFRPELLFINQRVDEGFPAARASSMGETKLLAKGEFHGVAHDGKGLASVHRLPSGEHVLRFTGFETSNGPALRVYLVAADDASDNATVTRAGFVDLGVLKGNIGEQNYPIPPETDLSKYRAVTVWCSRFNVNFATAPLKRGV